MQYLIKYQKLAELLMNEFSIINKYLKPLSGNNSSSLNLQDDIFFDKNRNLAISTDTYIEGVHFLKSSKPKDFIKKILRSSLSDLYCKGVKPKAYFLSVSLNKKYAKHSWLEELKKTLAFEQKKFNIFLGGGDTTSSSKLIITITVIGFARKVVLRNGSVNNDDIYITGNICDAFLGLCILKKKINLRNYNQYFIKKYYQPDLPIKIVPYLCKIATASIDISDGLIQDLKHICKNSKCGALIDLNYLPLSAPCKNALSKNKIDLKNIFSKGDDYQILFTSKRKFRSEINHLSKKMNLKISKIGTINKDMNINFKYKGKKFKLTGTKMGYTHTF